MRSKTSCVLRIAGGIVVVLLLATPEIVEVMMRFLRTGDPGRTEIVLPPL